MDVGEGRIAMLDLGTELSFRPHHISNHIKSLVKRREGIWVEVKPSNSRVNRELRLVDRRIGVGSVSRMENAVEVDSRGKIYHGG